MSDVASQQRIHGYCALCTARCGSIAVVEDGRFTRLEPDPAHPTGQALCAKGRAAPELVYHKERLTHPLRRTRPKGDPDPGWERIGWDEALDLTAAAMRRIADAAGAGGRLLQPVLAVHHRDQRFGVVRPAPDERVRHAERGQQSGRMRLGACRRDPLHLWRRAASPPVRGGAMPDIANTGCLILWGYNPSFSRLSHATAMVEALKRGMRLIVVDPRHVGLGNKADLWLRVRPGTDGALALGIANLMIQRGWYDREFIRNWSNGPMLVRADNGRLLTERDLAPDGDGEPQRRLGHAAAAGPYDRRGHTTATARISRSRANTASPRRDGDVICHPGLRTLCAAVSALSARSRSRRSAGSRVLRSSRPRA